MKHRTEAYASVRHPNVSIESESSEHPSLDDVYAASEGMRRVAALCRRLVESRGHAWMSGEPGSGKQWLARAIAAGPMSEGRPFVSVDCRSLAEGAFEHKLLRSARHGVLYLRHIESLSAELQAELLQALCSDEAGPADVDAAQVESIQVLVATRRPPEEALSGTRFRDDLFRRLRGLHVAVPPLRERLEDLPGLASALARKHGMAVNIYNGPVTIE